LIGICVVGETHPEEAGTMGDLRLSFGLA